MRPAAEVEPFALPVDLQVLAFGNRVDELDLEMLALVAEHLLASSRLHTSLVKGASRAMISRILASMAGKVLGRERLVAGEIVIEAVLDHRADGHLGAGIERLHGFGEDMRGVVADELERARIVARRRTRSGRRAAIGSARSASSPSSAIAIAALGERLGDAFGDLAAGHAGAHIAAPRRREMSG